jgi:hypothetical protein
MRLGHHGALDRGRDFVRFITAVHIVLGEWRRRRWPSSTRVDSAARRAADAALHARVLPLHPRAERLGGFVVGLVG